MEDKPNVKIIFNFDKIELPNGSPEVMAINLARRFYREMLKHNFDEKQIIKVATELIGCLSSSLKGYKKRVSERKHVRNDIGV